MSGISIRPIVESDRAAWRPLWDGYLEFYAQALPEEMTDHTWRRIVDGAGLRGLLAVDASGAALGFAHYLFHASSWRRSGNCYLEDLYVAPAARGKRIGRRLIEALAEKAKSDGYGRLYWHTEEFNGTARRLYERLAKRAPFVKYQIDL